MNSYVPSALKTGLPSLAPPPVKTAADTASAAGSGAWDLSFHNLLGIINPLQHLPVVGTLYRAITGDSIGTPEKIAGDALYGGLWGAVSGVADAAFESVTGKDFGATVLAMFTGHHDAGMQDAKPVGVAANTAATPVAAAQSPDVAALSSALAAKGVDGDVAQRALAAYQRGLGGGQNPVLASLH